MNYAIVPYVNNLEQTQQAVQDLVDQSLPTRILTVANGGDRYFDIRRDVVGWRYVPGLPLAAVWNSALQFVWEAGGEHALVVNNDVRLPAFLYEILLKTLKITGAWFITATNQATEDRYQRAVETFGSQLTHDFLISRGGPDFSCFLITKECHRWFQFDEGFTPAYHEDNDYHRRLQLAGFGDKIFSVCVPYLHYGSGTLKSNPKLAESWGPKFQQSQQYYVQKWGGLPGQETYTIPFNSDADKAFRPVHSLTGQGRPGHTEHLWPK